MRKIIIDTDTATDDAVAIMMALKNDHFNIKAITTVAGNVDLNQATSNALYTCELCEKYIPDLLTRKLNFILFIKSL